MLARALALALGSLGLVTCGGVARAGDGARGLRVVAIDGLRADHLSCYGYDRATTPELDRLGAEGVRFAQAFSAAPRCLPAHVALLTGCDPNLARRVLPNELAASEEGRWAIPAVVPRLAVELLAHGWCTAAFVDDARLAPVYGFAAGFQEYVESESDAPWDSAGVGLEALGPRFLQWLRGLDRDEPWFAYLQISDLERSWRWPREGSEEFFEPRAALADVPPVATTDTSFYAIPRSRWRGSARTLGEYEASYDGHVRGLDQDLGRILGTLEQLGRAANTTVVVVGSFGMQLGEAGLYLCAGRYSMADLHVPWIVKPGAWARGAQVAPGTVVESVASALDLAPTLLDLAGIAAPRSMRGISLAPFVRGGKVTRERSLAFASCGLQDGCAVVGARWCLEYLRAGGVGTDFQLRSWFGEDAAHEGEWRARFYDRRAQPFPPLDLARPAEPAQDFALLRDAAVHWVQEMEFLRHALQRSLDEAPSIDPALYEELRAQGLVEGSR
jgi:arylsulfatase